MNNRFIRKNINLLACMTLAVTSSSLYAEDAYDVIEIKNTIVTTENPTPENNQTYVYDINNSDLVTGYFIVPDFFEDLDNNGIDDVNDSYSRSFLLSSVFEDAGAIDNSEVLVTISNEVDGQTVTEEVNVGVENTPSYSFAINEDGLSVGFSFEMSGIVSSSTVEDDDGNDVTTETAKSSSLERAVIYTPNVQTPTIIPDLVADDPQKIRALSISGDKVVGFGNFNPVADVDSEGDLEEKYYARGFIFDSATQEIKVIQPEDANSSMLSIARDININNIVTGWAERLVNEKRVQSAFYLADAMNTSEVTPLTLFGNEESTSKAWSINDKNLIVGQATNAENTHYTAFMYDIDNSLSYDLGILNSSTPFAEAFDINVRSSDDVQDGYQVVGNSIIQVSPSTVKHAFIYENGVMKDLNDLIDCTLSDNGSREWILNEARAINDNGVIVGNGLLNGVQKAFMLRPKAEGETIQACEVESEDGGSGSLSLVYVSVLGLVWFRRRKNTQ